MSFSDFAKHRITSHILFWLAYISYFSFQYGYTRSDYLITFVQQCLFLTVIVPAVYYNVYVLISKLLLEKKYRSFIIYFIPTWFVFVTLFRILTKYISPVLFYSEQYQASVAQIAFYSPLYIMSHTFSIYSVVFLVAFIKLVKRWYSEQQRNQMLTQEKLEAELKYLKAQINPHVLFNVLNNLYGLSLAGSKKTPEMILKLSSLLDFMLYECNPKFIPLNKEINMLKDYIDLEKLRFGDRLTVDFKVNGNISNVSIAPLLLFPIVENSFKHGAGQETENAWINISITTNTGSIIFIVKNSKADDNIDTGENKNGIGLKNIKRRLELLYKERFSLDIEDNKTYFFVKLVLQYNEDNDENQMYNS